MDPQTVSSLPSAAAAADDDGEAEGRLCSCGCPCCSSSSPPSSSAPSSVPRPKKRRLGQMTDGDAAAAAGGDGGGVARVEMENEVAALRDAVASLQQTVQELCAELEEERGASETAASETMSMILRLQREKAEVQMEARNFKRFAEEKMAHDQEVLATLDELLLKRDEALQFLSYQVQAYRHRLLSYGIDPEISELSGAAAAADLEYNYEARSPQFDSYLPERTVVGDDLYDYPSLKCTIPEQDEEEEDVEAEGLEKYAFGETPRGKKVSFDSEQAVDMSNSTCVMEKGVVGQSPTGSNDVQESPISSRKGQELKKAEEFPATVDRLSDVDTEADNTNDKVYTIDMVYGIPKAAVSEGHKDEHKEVRVGEANEDADHGANVDIKKLYMRLQALEEDREMMRQAIVTMRTEKAQFVLLKEMAQQLRKEVVPDKKIVKKKSLVMSLSLLIIPMFKWIVSFVLWKKRASPSKYTFGLSTSNVGLLLLLDKSPQLSYWNRLSRNSVATSKVGQIGPSSSQS